MASQGRDLKRFMEFGRKIIGVGRNFRLVLCRRIANRTVLGLITVLCKFHLHQSVTFLGLFRPHGSPQQPPPAQDPLIFLKPSSTYLSPGGKIKVCSENKKLTSFCTLVFIQL